MSFGLVAAAAAAALAAGGLTPVAAAQPPSAPPSPSCEWRLSALGVYWSLPTNSTDPHAAQVRAELVAAGVDRDDFLHGCGGQAPSIPPGPTPSRDGSTSGTSGQPCPTGERPYFPAADWLWNPIPDGATLDPNSSAMASELSSGPHILNTGEFGVALVNPDEVSPSTPRATVPLSEDWGPDPLAGLKVPVPPDLKIPPGSDGHVAIADRATDTVVNLWVAKRSGSGLAANWGAATPLDGDGREHNGSSTGAGIARYAAVVRASEIADGDIPHALFFSTNVVKPGEVRYPATKTDGSNMDGAGSPIPEGARVRLDPSIDVDAIPGISKGEATIARALQRYGAYVGDNGGARMAFIAEYAPNSDAYESAGISGDFVALDAVPWDRLQVLSDWSGGTQATPGGDEQLPDNRQTTDSQRDEQPSHEQRDDDSAPTDHRVDTTSTKTTSISTGQQSTPSCAPQPLHSTRSDRAVPGDAGGARQALDPPTDPTATRTTTTFPKEH